MIKIGNILIDPNEIVSIHRELKTPNDERHRGFIVIQVIYKNGVVKNFTTVELGVQSCEEFMDAFQKESEKKSERELLRMMAAIKSMNNG